MALVLTLGMCWSASAGLRVEDHWADAGTLLVRGDDWQAEFRRDRNAFSFSRGDQELCLAVLDAQGRETGSPITCEVSMAGDAEVAVRASFTGDTETPRLSIHFGESGTFRVSPEAQIDALSLRCPIAIGVLPGSRLEDVLYDPKDFVELQAITLPCENLFGGLLDGGNGIVACAWPDGAQTIKLTPNGDAVSPLFEECKLAPDGKDVYLDILAAQGIWFRAKLDMDFLEKDRALDWKRPFRATYATQLPMKAESTAIRTFLLRDGRAEEWRPEIGSYVWPAWFEGDRAYLSLSKRIPPKGDVVIYPIDGEARTLTGFLKRTPVAEIIAKRNDGRGLPRGPRAAPNVGFNSCWGTFLIRRTIYKFGLQQREQEFLREHARFLADHVAVIQKHNTTYFEFIETMRARLGAWLDAEENVDVKEYLEAMGRHLEAVEQGHREKMALYGDATPEAHVAHADRNLARLDRLVENAGTEMYPECFQLIDEFNRMSCGHNESTGMRFSMLTRAWAQDAAKGCAAMPAAARYAKEIRDALRDALNGAPGW